ncbi:MAG: DMT family transporter [Pseudomonadota bacterium]
MIPAANDPLRGIAYKLFSVLCFTLMAICVKLAAARIPTGETVFFRSFCAFPVILTWLAWRGRLRFALRTSRPLDHFWRGIIGTSAMALNFTALGLLPLPEVTTLFYTAPLFMVVFAVFLLGERVRLIRITALAIGLTGTIIVLYPRLSVFDLEGAGFWAAIGAAAALLGAILAALAQVFIRYLTATEDTGTIVLYFTVTSTLLSLLTLPFGWIFPTGFEAVCLVGAGLFGGLGQITLTEAYRNAALAVVAPFEYLSIVLSIAAGMLLFGEWPTAPMLAGAALITASGLAIIWRERQIQEQRKLQGSKAPIP